jgi:hypothetical protein
MCAWPPLISASSTYPERALPCASGAGGAGRRVVHFGRVGVGNGTGGFTGDGGPATGAELDFPTGLAADGHNLLISDNRRIRRVTG